MLEALSHDRRSGEVWERLATVTDPELDESVTELGFVELVTISGDGGVEIVFRLPTYWCSASFAFLMADDMRKAVSSLPWVREARPKLQDHMVAEEINQGVAQGKSFSDALKDFAPGGSLDELREKFRRKAFERRQEVMILALRQAGYGDAAICRMTLGAYEAVEFGDAEVTRQKARYRDAAAGRHVSTPIDCAFLTYEGTLIEPGELGSYLRRLRGVRINMEFSSSLCKGLLAARYVDKNACGTCGSACATQPADSPGE